MPALAAIPWLVPLITGVSAAGTLASTGYELAQGGGSSTPTTGTSTAAQQAAQQAAAQKTAFLAAAPNVQASTGGSLTPSGFNTATATQAGVPSDLNSIAQYLGLGGGGTSSSPTSAPISGGTTAPNGGQQNGQGADLQSLSDLLKAA